MRRILTAIGLVGLSVPATAAPSCDANNLYSFAFQSAATATLSYASSYSYTATNPLGATRSIGVSFATNGLSSSQVDGGSGNVQMPRIDNNIVGSDTSTKTLTIGGTFSGRTTNITSGTRSIVTTFTFATPIRDLALTVHDIDYANNQFRDWFYASGSDGTNTYIPAMSSPAGNNNAGTPTATNSSLRYGPYTGTTPNLTNAEAMGVGASTNTGVTTGQIGLSFTQPVTSVTLRYGNYPLQFAEFQTGQQFMGISRLSFCPMPVVSVAKTSAPYATTGVDRFNTPGADVVYTLTATNSGGSPVDASTLILTDTLPANVSFYNGDFNPAVVGSGPIQLTAGSSGVTVGSIAYSNGTSYGMTPAAGYDPAVKGVRVTLSGSMAANSTAIVKFRAQIK